MTPSSNTNEIHSQTNGSTDSATIPQDLQLKKRRVYKKAEPKAQAPYVPPPCKWGSDCRKHKETFCKYTHPEQKEVIVPPIASASASTSASASASASASTHGSYYSRFVAPYVSQLTPTVELVVEKQVIPRPIKEDDYITRFSKWPFLENDKKSIEFKRLINLIDKDDWQDFGYIKFGPLIRLYVMREVFLERHNSLTVKEETFKKSLRRKNLQLRIKLDSLKLEDWFSFDVIDHSLDCARDFYDENNEDDFFLEDVIDLI